MISLLNKTSFKITALVVLVFITYIGTFSHGFIWDDDVYLTQRALRSIDGLKTIWIQPTSTDHPYYPLTHSLFWLLDQIWGQNSFVYHLVNVVIHSVNAVLVWLILRKLKILAPWVCALVFAVHPVHVESVAWIAQIKNTLSAMFYLLSVYLFVYFRFQNTDENEWQSKSIYYVLSLLMFALSMLSKTAFCMLPVGLLIIQWYKSPQVTRKDIVLTLPYFVIAGVVGVFTIWMEYNHVGSHGEYFTKTFLERIFIAGHAIWFYALKLLVPLQLNFVYPRWNVDAASFVQSLFPLSVIGLICLLWMKQKHWGKGVLAALGFFIVHLFPVLGFINIYMHRYTFVTDHWQYIASLGISTLYTVGLIKICQKGSNKKKAYGVVGCLICVLSVLSISQGKIYKNRYTVFNDVVNKDPESWFGYLNRGAERLGHDDEGAFDDFQKALKYNSQLSEAHNNIAMLYFKKNNYAMSLKHFTKAIEINPEYYMSYIRRGVVYMKLKKFKDSIKDYQTAMQYKPDHPMIYNNRGLLYEAIGQEDAALEDFQKAVSLDQYDYAISYYNRGRIYQKRNHLSQALRDYSRSIEIHPLYIQAYNNRAVVYSLMGNEQMAFNDLEYILSIDPTNMSIQKNLSVIKDSLKRKNNS